MKIDLFVRAVHEPKKIIIKIKKRDKDVILHVYAEAEPPKDGELKLGTFVELMDIINDTNFYLFLMNSFRASGGQK
jgi:succinate dehydrogenase flavin-adding protein (antitoxin of CptAB toxin-antitoxin module)